MNDIEKLIQLTAEEHDQDKSSARFFWFIFLLDKGIGVAALLAVLGLILLWCFYGR
jgi:hypothetical protein